MTYAYVHMYVHTYVPIKNLFPRLDEESVKRIVYQTLKAVNYIHLNNVRFQSVSVSSPVLRSQAVYLRVNVRDMYRSQGLLFTGLRQTYVCTACMEGELQ